MALRVLLADESSTIKKVLQLALQDFAVEVKAVPVGLDVLQVAKSFKPDIVFADVLLQKRNGYEVSGDIKKDPTLKNTPVVLMWSGFMELDEAKAKECMADRRLEKPFDAETLRGLVKDLVPTTNTNLISQFLSFPELPSMVEEQAPADIPNLGAAAEPEFQPLTFSGLQSDPSEEQEEFQNVPLNRAIPSASAQSTAKPSTPKTGGGDNWSRQDLSRFKIELPPEEVFENPISDLTSSSIALSSGVDNEDLSILNVSLADLDSNSRPQAPPPANKKAGILPNRTEQATGAYAGTNLGPVSPNTAEQILREEARAVIESVAWKVLPEIVERVVREELQKLLKDAERL